MVLGEGLVIMYHAGCKRNGGPLVHHLHTHQLKVENKQNGQHTDIHVCIYIYYTYMVTPTPEPTFGINCWHCNFVMLSVFFALFIHSHSSIHTAIQVINKR